VLSPVSHADAPVPMRPVASGFPSPADDYVEAAIDLNVELIPRPLSTFFMRVSGEAMRGDGIVDGDLLVIDRSVDARPGMVVVATHEGSFLVRRLACSGGRLWLAASDAALAPLPLGGDGEGGLDAAELWGVVLHAVHHLAPAPSRRHGRIAGPGVGRGFGGGGRQREQEPAAPQFAAEFSGGRGGRGGARDCPTVMEPGATQVAAQGQQSQGDADADEKLQAEFQHGMAP
jgi:DNA polymerase V